jgi:integrase/recombinase XerD
MPTVPKEVYEKRIAKTMQALDKNPHILEENKETIKEYLKHLILNGYSYSRIYKNALYLMEMAEQIKVPFKYAETRDIEDIVLWITQRPVAEDTKVDYKIVLKRFYRWIGNGEYPSCVKWLRTTKRKSDEKLPEDILTEEDVKKMIDAAENARDRAFIALLWDTGARMGELIDLKLKNIEDDPHGKRIVLRGKTGARRLFIIFSVPYVQAWMAAHPFRNDPEAPLWVNVGTKNSGKKVGYAALNHMLRKVAKKAGINKPVNPHHFRHSRATFLANTMTESQLDQWFGWVQGSRVPAVYVHLSGRDLDSTYAKIYGMDIGEDKRTSKFKPKKCPRCGAIVEPDAKFCHRCGMALDVDTAKELEDVQERMMMEFMNNPELMKSWEAIRKLVEIYEAERKRGVIK